jgi:indole-3-glycerol phosphate synthase
MTESPSTYLDRILADKRSELAGRRAQRPGATTAAALRERLEGLAPTLDFGAALSSGSRPRVIAEFKRASPSQGPIREDADVREIVSAYQRAGAAAISVLCDRHFEGSLDDLRTARRVLDIPLLCKDFILERSQILEAREAGADAVLLIVAALPPPTLRPLVAFAHELGMQVLCEAHDAHEIDRAMSAGARIIGINARDLKTFELDLDRALALRSQVPRSFVCVAESGIASPSDLRKARDAGVDAVLVGTTLMAADDPAAALEALLDGSP